MPTVKGAEELIAKLQSLKKTDAKAALRKGTRIGSKEVAEAAKRIAPQHTGALAQAIKVRALPRSKKWTGTTIKLEIRYGAFVEFGLRNRHMDARHMLEKAAEEVGEQAKETAVEEAKAEIERRLSAGR